MNSTMLSVGELTPQKFENVDTRNISSSQLAATECHQRNFRDGFQGNQTRCSSGSFNDMFPNVHSEAALCGAGHVRRAPVRLACGCSGQEPELFYDHDHDHHQSTSLNRCCHGTTGSSTTNGNQTGHLHSFCDRGCCGSVAIHRERTGLANCGVDRARTTSRSSLFLDSLELQRNAAAVGSLSHFPSTPREVETRSSSLHTGSMANSAFHTQTKAANKQIILYGWFLMKPLRENCSLDPSAFSSVAIGGYRCPRMEEKDFVGTAIVVRRLERWKLRTSDGLEVGLMGMINIEKSVANGFSPSNGVGKGSSPGMLSPSASPNNAVGSTGVIKNPLKDCQGMFMTVPLETNPVQSILQSSLFTATPDLETKTASLRRCSRDTTTPSQDGVSSDANSAPQVPLGKDQVDEAMDADAMFLEGDFASQNAAPQQKERFSGMNCSPSIRESDVTRGPGEDPETSCQAQVTSRLEASSSDTNDVKVEDGSLDSPVPSSVAIQNTSDEVHLEVSNEGAANRDSHKDSAHLISMAPDDVPGTPLMQNRKRSLSDIDTPAADTLSTEQVDPNSTLQYVEVSKLSSKTPVLIVHTPITASVGFPSSPVQNRDGGKRSSSESDSHLADIAVVKQIAISVAEPSDTVKCRDKRKRRRRRISHSPVADIPVELLVAVPDPVGRVETRIRRSRPKSESQLLVADIPVVEPISVSVPGPMDTVTIRSTEARPEKELHVPGTGIPVVEQGTCSVPDLVGTVQSRERRKSRRIESNVPVADIPLEPCIGIACCSGSGDCQAGSPPDATEQGAHAEQDDELGKWDTIQRADLDVEGNQACKDTAEVKWRARRKRYKISRNYYQRVKKSCSKRPTEKGPSKPDRSAAILETPTEETKFDFDESRIVKEMTEVVKTIVNRTTERNIPEDASSLEVPESLTEDSHIKRSRQTKKSIVPPPLPQPRVVDKSKVTEAYGLKRSVHGRVLVPPLATWRSQSIKYDMDGGIIAISDGFTGSADESCTGYYNFKPPGDKGARTMQRRLCKAADEGSGKNDKRN